MYVLMAAAAAAPESPWNPVTITTAIIASLSFLVAGGGLFLGLFNYRHQSRRDFPRAHWDERWVKNDDGTITFWFLNDGAGDALEVELWCLVGKDGEELTWKRIKEYGTVSRGDKHSMNFGATSKRDVEVELHYRHGAKVEKLRKKRFTGKR